MNSEAYSKRVKNMRYADGHSDFLSRAIDLSEKDWEKLVSPPEKLKRNDYIMQIYAIYTSNDSLATKSALRQAQLFRSLKYPKILSKDDVPDDDGQFSILLALEGLLPIDGHPELLYVFHDLGVRMASLVWSRINSFADGSLFRKPRTGRGITPIGEEALKIMEELGWILDISHLNDEGVKDVFKKFNGTIVATHSNPRHFCDIERNLPDEFMEEIAKRGGIMGVNYSVKFMTCGDEASIKDIIKNLEYMVRIMGEDAVGLGSDADGLPRYPEGFKSADDIHKIGQALVEAFGKELAEKIAYKNWLRVLRSSLK